MRWKLSLLAGAAVLALASTVFAQSIGTNPLTGNECWNAGQGPGGPAVGYVCANVMRDGAALRVFSGSGAQTYTATTQDSTLYWTSTAPTTWTITTPPSPSNGQILTIGTDTLLTSLVTLTANTGQTINTAFSSGTINAASSIAYQYSTSTTKWYRIR